MYLFPYVLHGLCEDYLTCDIAFSAVMPLSRASTCRRYSRIEGITQVLRTLQEQLKILQLEELEQLEEFALRAQKSLAVRALLRCLVVCELAS